MSRTGEDISTVALSSPHIVTPMEQFRDSIEAITEQSYEVLVRNHGYNPSIQNLNFPGAKPHPLELTIGERVDLSFWVPTTDTTTDNAPNQPLVHVEKTYGKNAVKLNGDRLVIHELSSLSIIFARVTEQEAMLSVISKTDTRTHSDRNVRGDVPRETSWAGKPLELASPIERPEDLTQRLAFITGLIKKVIIGDNKS